MRAPRSTVRATRYEVSCLPEAHPARRHFTLTVRYRGHDTWAVMRDDTLCLSASGDWHAESLPSDLTGEWAAEHRFDLYTALAKAGTEAQRMVVNGLSVAEVIHESRSAKEP